MEEEEEEKGGRVNPAALFAASVRNLLALGSVSNWDTVYGCVTRHPSLSPSPSPSPPPSPSPSPVASHLKILMSETHDQRVSRAAKRRIKIFTPTKPSILFPMGAGTQEWGKGRNAGRSWNSEADVDAFAQRELPAVDAAASGPGQAVRQIKISERQAARHFGNPIPVKHREQHRKA